MHGACDAAEARARRGVRTRQCWTETPPCSRRKRSDLRGAPREGRSHARQQHRAAPHRRLDVFGNRSPVLHPATAGWRSAAEKAMLRNAPRRQHVPMPVTRVRQDRHRPLQGSLKLRRTLNVRAAECTSACHAPCMTPPRARAFHSPVPCAQRVALENLVCRP